MKIIQLALGLCMLAALPGVATPSIVIRNNYDMPYTGPVSFRTSLPDGYYAGKGAAGNVSAGLAYFGAKLPAGSQVKLRRIASKGSPEVVVGADRAIKLSVDGGVISLRRGSDEVAEVDFGLSIIPGRTATADNAVSSFQPMGISMKRTADGAISGYVETRGYGVNLTIQAIGGNWIDVNAEVTNISGDKSAAYVALVRRVKTMDITSPRMRWNGRILDGAVEPVDYLGSYSYCHCIDWCSWKSGGLSFVVANGFTPGLTTEQSTGKWANAGHFYVWEHLRRQASSTGSGCDSLFFISEIAGPDPSQKPDYAGIKAYMPPLRGEPVKLYWRLAITQSARPHPNPLLAATAFPQEMREPQERGKGRTPPQPSPQWGGGENWEESQFLVSAGYRRVSYPGADASARKASDRSIGVDLGVPYVEFGTSYFPYSTITENFDFYRTTGLDREGWWPFSAPMWEKWRVFAPQMKTDLRIIRAMGLEWVRMHRLEIISTMDRANAMDFIDFYMNECRKLGLKVLIDTACSPEWFATIAGRYKDVVKCIEIENEVLIPGIKPGDPARWKACYAAAKQAAPGTDIFLTGNCNLGMFDRLTQLDVPYDRLGYHSYKHGPGAEETLSSLAVAVAGVAADRGKTPVLAEFNWKFLTRLSPEARAKEWALIFGNLLKPRAVPELLQFHWQETMSVNPLLTRQGIRHYETIYLDRRPKPEALEFMKLIRQYRRADAPVRELPIKITSTAFVNGKTRAEFVVTNWNAKPLTVKLTPECFGDTKCRLTSASSITLRAGRSANGTVEVTLKPNALPGVYHFFVKAIYSDKISYGWGYASNIGIPTVDKDPVMPDLVDYPQTVVDAAPTWSQANCVAFGPDAPIVEMEMAYVVANTLQSATGRAIRLCSTADIPAKMLETGVIILVGTPESNPLIASKPSVLSLAAGRGVVKIAPKTYGRDEGPRLLLSGDSSKAVEAAATEFVLRYWKNAKDSAIRITGMEKGAALGNRAAPGQINPP